MARLARKAARGLTLDEPLLDQLPEHSGNRVLGNLALARSVADGECNLSVIGAVISAFELDIDSPGTGCQGQPRR